MKLRLIDKFADWILNQKLFELATQRSTAIDRICDISDTLNSHLFKLYVFPKSQYKSHWENEIENYIKYVSKQGWGKQRKHFEYQDYYDWLFYEFFYNKYDQRINLNRDYKNILKQYPNEQPRENWNDENFYDKCQIFYKIICVMLEREIIDWDTFDEILQEFEL